MQLEKPQLVLGTHHSRRDLGRAGVVAQVARGILGGLAICTVIYVVVGAVMVGMVPYRELAVADPLARALELAGFTSAGWVVSVGAVVSMAAVLLVFQYGQPRIFFAMARDGLLPRWAAAVHPRTRVPSARG